MEPLTVPGTLDSLRAIAQYVLAAAAAAGLDKKATYNLRQGVDEIATNIIIHGYKEAGLEGVLELRSEMDDRTLTICIEDTAVPYDPYQTERVEQEELKLPLEQRKMGGLGVYLAIEGIDKFTYERVENRNRNIFVMNRLSA